MLTEHLFRNRQQCWYAFSCTSSEHQVNTNTGSTPALEIEVLCTIFNNALPSY